MSSSVVVVITVLIAAFGVAYVIGRLMTLRAGMLKAADEASNCRHLRPRAVAASDRRSCTSPRSGAARARRCDGWSIRCAGSCPSVAHVEIDMDANPEAARRLSVLSLPTTLIFDADGRPRYRTTGVPRAADLRSALEPLLA